MIHISKNILVVFLVLLMVGACTDFEDLNEDPNNPTEVPAVNLVSQAQYELYDIIHERGYNAEWGMLMVQQWAQNEYTEESRYNVNTNDFDVEFVTLYASVLNELKEAAELIEVDETLTEDVRANQLAVIEILNVQAYQTLVEGFGAVPYSQALNPDEFPLPAYDSQEMIFNDLLERLDNAVTSIEVGAESFGDGDLIYGGDMAAWKKLGSSLLLRLAMRIVDVAQSTASPYIQNANDYGLMESNDDNGLFVFSSNPSLANPLFKDRVQESRDDFCVSELLVETLNDMGDPRLEAYAMPNVNGNFKGMPYGLTDGEAILLKGESSRPNDEVRSETSPHVIMDYAEVSFLLAEAYERGLLSGDAESAFNDGVRASMNYWGFTDESSIDDYLDANPYDAANWKESIGLQKWLAFYMNGPQAWAEWRRLGYPQLEVPEAAVEDFIPVRLPYPVSEQTRNSSSLSAVTSSPGDLSTHLWWDVD